MTTSDRAEFVKARLLNRGLVQPTEVEWRRVSAPGKRWIRELLIADRAIARFKLCQPPLPAGAHDAEQPTKGDAQPLSNSPDGSTMSSAGIP